VKEQDALFKLASVAVHVTIVVPVFIGTELNVLPVPDVAPLNE
jgi:hypothetical protein